MKKHQKTKAKNSTSPMRWLFYNICLLLMVVFLLTKVVEMQPGYKWVYRTLLQSNVDYIRAHRHDNYHQRLAAKLGNGYGVILQFKQMTPPDAVILWPDANAFKKKGSPISAEFSHKLYALRFLYPRKLVTRKEAESNRYPITHIAVINGESAADLDSAQINNMQFGIIPVTQP